MALSRVQSATNSQTGSALSVTLPAPPTAGNLVVVSFSANDNAGGLTLSGVTPGYGLLPNGDLENTGELHSWVYWKVAEAGDAAAISATIDDSRNWVVEAVEYHNSLPGSWGVDRSASDAGNGATASSNMTPATSQASEVWVSVIANRDSNSQSAPTNGFVNVRNSSRGSGTTGLRSALYEKIVAATGPAGMAVTISGGGEFWVGGVYAFFTLPVAKTPLLIGRAVQNRVSRVRRLPHVKLFPPTAVRVVPFAVNTVPPVASGGPVVGQTVATTDGTWTGVPTSFTYQWFRDDHGGGTYAPIGGALANTYVLDDTDIGCFVRCEVTAHNERGSSAPAVTNAIGVVVESPPVNTVLPVVTGNAAVNAPLSADTGTWLHMSGFGASFSYQWQTSPDGVNWADVAVSGAFQFYWPTSADVGMFVRVLVTATNTGGTATAASAAAGPVGTLIAVIEPHTLGCGQYEAVILTRGGGSLVAVLPWTSLDWGRILDDTSDATASGATGTDAKCCAAIAQIRPWRHELALYRNGDQVWVGPILQVKTPPGGFEIAARDLSAWWDHRLIHRDHNFVQTDLATIFQAFFDDAMAPDDSPGIVLQTSLCGVIGSKRVLTSQHQLAGLALRDLTNTGIDWTAFGRTVLAGGVVVPTQPIGTFTDAHFVEPPTPILSGEQQTNSPTVRGAGGGASGDRYAATATNFAAAALDGLLESVETVSTITDYTSALQAASTQKDLKAQIIQVESAKLAPSAPFPLSLLVPGALCELNLKETCLPVVGTYRLKSINSANASGQDDSITLIFQPEGTRTATGG